MAKSHLLTRVTTIAITPENRDWLRGLGRKGDDYNDIIEAIRAILKQKNVTSPITPH